MTAVTICGLAITPVKSTRLQKVDRLRLDRHGARENRRFFLIDEDSELVNATHLGELNTVVSGYSDRRRRLSLAFADGRVVEEDVTLGDEIMTRFHGEQLPARLVLGEFSDAISQHVGKQLRLVESGELSAVDRGPSGAVTLISRASLARLADEAGHSSVDSRRFRMMIEVDGLGAHEEDAWVGHELHVGEVVLRAQGHVGRCVITSRHPETGEIDLHTLKILGRYRRHLDTTEPIAFGIYGDVVRPGEIRVGDTVTLVDD